MRKLSLALLIVALAALPVPLRAAGEEEFFEKAYSMEGITKISVENVMSSWPAMKAIDA